MLYTEVHASWLLLGMTTSSQLVDKLGGWEQSMTSGFGNCVNYLSTYPYEDICSCKWRPLEAVPDSIPVHKCRHYMHPSKPLVLDTK